jgi:hypothetical protein
LPDRWQCPRPIAAPFSDDLIALRPAKLPITQGFAHHLARRGILPAFHRLAHHGRHFRSQRYTDFLDICHNPSPKKNNSGKTYYQYRVKEMFIDESMPFVDSRTRKRGKLHAAPVAS